MKLFKAKKWKIGWVEVYTSWTLEEPEIFYHKSSKKTAKMKSSTKLKLISKWYVSCVKI
mgnify:CR=1 FL=1